MVIQDDERLKGIRDRWIGSSAQRAAARTAVGRRELSLANGRQELQERRERLQRRGLKLEGIVEADDSVWSSFFDCGLMAARSVGRVVEAPVRQPVRPIGTGSLVTGRLLLTNNHVCETPQDAEQMAVQFGYEYAEGGSQRPADQWRFAPGDFFVTDPDLDYTLVALAEREGTTPGSRYGHIPLIAKSGKVVLGEVLNVSTTRRVNANA